MQGPSSVTQLYKTAKINFINSGPVDIIRTVYYIHWLELMKLIFAVLYVSWTMGLTRCYKKLIRRWDSERELFTTTSYTHYRAHNKVHFAYGKHMSIGAKWDFYNYRHAHRPKFAPTRSHWLKISGRRGRPPQIIFARIVRPINVLQLYRWQFSHRCYTAEALRAKIDRKSVISLQRGHFYPKL